MGNLLRLQLFKCRRSKRSVGVHLLRPAVSFRPPTSFAALSLMAGRDEVSALAVIHERTASLASLKRLDGVFAALLLESPEVALVVVAREVAEEQSGSRTQLLEVEQETGRWIN